MIWRVYCITNVRRSSLLSGSLRRSSYTTPVLKDIPDAGLLRILIGPHRTIRVHVHAGFRTPHAFLLFQHSQRPVFVRTHKLQFIMDINKSQKCKQYLEYLEYLEYYSGHYPVERGF